MAYPSRIVCLTEEPTEVLYALGEDHRIVGISRFTVRPPRARAEKPRVSAFTRADTEAILQLEPDLVIGFSDIQADIARDLIKAGVEVWIANHRTVEGILSYVLRLGAMVGAADRAEEYVLGLRRHLEEVGRAAAGLAFRPRVYFEEWDDPLITGIAWVAELIRIAGGDDVFPEKSVQPLAVDRIVQPAEVVERDPDLIVASWCGKRFRPDTLISRPGWSNIRAVVEGQVHEIDASIILQPGPAALTDGLDALARLVRDWVENRPAPVR